jgi:hypothetical protein
LFLSGLSRTEYSKVVTIGKCDDSDVVSRTDQQVGCFRPACHGRKATKCSGPESVLGKTNMAATTTGGSLPCARGHESVVYHNATNQSRLIVVIRGLSSVNKEHV